MTDLNYILLQGYYSFRRSPVPHFWWMLMSFLLLEKWGLMAGGIGTFPICSWLGNVCPDSFCRGRAAGEEGLMLHPDTWAWGTGTTLLKPSQAVPVPSRSPGSGTSPWDGQTHLQQLCQTLSIYSWNFPWYLSFPTYIYFFKFTQWGTFKIKSL